MTINEERVRKGIAALRSGEYPQARGSLRKGDCFCALGVFCDVYHKETGKGEWSSWSNGDGCNIEDDRQFFNGCEVLPSEVMHWYGFDDYDPIIIGDATNVRGRVTNLNDGKNLKKPGMKAWEFYFRGLGT